MPRRASVSACGRPRATATAGASRRCRRRVEINQTRLLPGSCTARVAHGLSDLCRLRYASDLRACNDLSSAFARLRRHAFARGGSSRGTRREVRGPVQCEGLSSRFDMCRPGCQIVLTPELRVDPFQRRCEHLLTLRSMLGGSRKARAASLGLSAALSLLLAADRSLLVAHLAQAGRMASSSATMQTRPALRSQ